MKTRLPHQSPFARLIDGRLADIYEVENGKACNCTCMTCGGLLVARQGKINVWHFAHLAGIEPIECQWAAETALHIAAKEILAVERSIMTPPAMIVASGRTSWSETVSKTHKIPSTRVDLITVELEKIINTIKPDVLATTAIAGKQLIVEITITHGLDVAKRKKLAELGIAAIEIDLKLYPHDITRDELRNILCEQVTEKTWAYNRKHVEIQKTLNKELIALIDELEKEYRAQAEKYDQVYKPSIEEPWQSPLYEPDHSGHFLRYELRSDGHVTIDAYSVEDQIEINTIDCKPDLLKVLVERFHANQSERNIAKIHKDRLPDLLIYLGSLSRSVRN